MIYIIRLASLLMLINISGCRNYTARDILLGKNIKDTIPATREPLNLFTPRESEKIDTLPAGNPKNRRVVLLYDTDGIYTYTGENYKAGVVMNYKQFRSWLTEQKKQISDSLVVVIKPHNNATYKNTVDMLDEMLINDIKKYTLIDIGREEKQVVDSIRLLSSL